MGNTHCQLKLTLSVSRFAPDNRLFVLLFGAVAIGCSVFTVLSCEFFQMTSATTTPDEFLVDGRIGLFSFQEDPRSDNATCIHYDDVVNFVEKSNWMKDFWTVAQYASLIAPAIGVIAWLISLGELLWGAFYGSFYLPILLFGMASLVQGKRDLLESDLIMSAKSTKLDFKGLQLKTFVPKFAFFAVIDTPGGIKTYDLVLMNQAAPFSRLRKRTYASKVTPTAPLRPRILQGLRAIYQLVPFFPSQLDFSTTSSRSFCVARLVPTRAAAP
jgi:hypothetical protein